MNGRVNFWGASGMCSVLWVFVTRFLMASADLQRQDESPCRAAGRRAALRECRPASRAATADVPAYPPPCALSIPSSASRRRIRRVCRSRACFAGCGCRRSLPTALRDDVPGCEVQCRPGKQCNQAVARDLFSVAHAGSSVLFNDLENRFGGRKPKRNQFVRSETRDRKLETAVWASPLLFPFKLFVEHTFLSFSVTLLISDLLISDPSICCFSLEIDKFVESSIPFARFLRLWILPHTSQPPGDRLLTCFAKQRSLR